MRQAAFDRPALRATPGLRFWRLLGTGRGESMTLGADLRRWALFAVWRRPDDLEAFLRRSPVAARWRDEAAELWQVRLAPLASRGRWGGADPFGGAVPPAARGEPEGPVAVLTRATIRLRRLAAFYRAVPEVDRVLREQEGRLASVGIGEWPVARQATFSLWRDGAAATAFAYRTAAHADVIRRVRARDWYAEELFARFAVLSASGTYRGVTLDVAPEPGHL